MRIQLIWVNGSNPAHRKWTYAWMNSRSTNKLAEKKNSKQNKNLNDTQMHSRKLYKTPIFQKMQRTSFRELSFFLLFSRSRKYQQQPTMKKIAAYFSRWHATQRNRKNGQHSHSQWWSQWRSKVKLTRRHLKKQVRLPRSLTVKSNPNSRMKCDGQDIKSPNKLSGKEGATNENHYFGESWTSLSSKEPKTNQTPFIVYDKK